MISQNENSKQTPASLSILYYVKAGGISLNLKEINMQCQSKTAYFCIHYNMFIVLGQFLFLPNYQECQVLVLHLC